MPTSGLAGSPQTGLKKLVENVLQFVEELHSRVRLVERLGWSFRARSRIWGGAKTGRVLDMLAFLWFSFKPTPRRAPTEKD